jgi:hypothetical protein
MRVFAGDVQGTFVQTAIWRSRGILDPVHSEKHRTLPGREDSRFDCFDMPLVFMALLRSYVAF